MEITFSAFLLPILAGYYLTSRLELLRYRNQRNTDQSQLFQSAILGLFLFIGLYGAVHGLYRFLPIEQLEWIRTFRQEVLRDVPFLGICLATVGVAVVGNSVMNLFTSKEKEIRRAIRKFGTELEKRCLESSLYGDTLQITLDTHKVYIGCVAKVPEPSPNRLFITILPFASGYRDPQTLKLTITQNYTLAYQHFANLNPDKDHLIQSYTLLIDANRILTVSYYEEAMSRAFNPTIQLSDNE